MAESEFKIKMIDWSSFTDFEDLSSGNFGVIRKADYLGTDVAIKEFKVEKGFNLDKYVGRELGILRESRHPNVVQFMGTTQHEGRLFMVTEYVGGGNLKSWIKDKSRDLSWRLRVSFALDVARALAYLHSNKIIHRDLKSENLLITENLRIKLCDFGFSRETASTAEERRRMSFCGTDDYMSPEIILGIPFDESVDIFSYGVILCELITRTLAEEQIFKREVPGFGINQETIAPEADCPATLKSLAVRCTDSEASKRPLLQEILKSLKLLEAELYKAEGIHPGLGKSTWNIYPVENVSTGSTPSISRRNMSTNTSRTHEDVPSVSNLSTGSLHSALHQLNTSTEPLSPIVNGQMRRIAHWIPHRFSIQKSGGIFSVCAGCSKRLGVGRKCLQCDDCQSIFHKECAKDAPATCGLPTEFKSSIILLDPNHHVPNEDPANISKSKSTVNIAPLKTASIFGGSVGNLFASKPSSPSQ